MKIKAFNKSDRKWLAMQLLTMIGITFLFSIVVIKNFSTPLDGLADIFHWEYSGYYLAKNIHFSPFPQLNLVNNSSFYPYGVNNVFQPWGVERDIFYAAFYSLFGFGSWIQLYYFLSVLITALGSFALLYKDFGSFRAWGIAILLTFTNLYAVKFYPIQMSYSIVHWTVLGMIVDFLLVKKTIYDQPISLRLWLVRLSLLILALGQELGYIAGYALMSFTLSFAYLITTLAYRSIKGKLNFNQFINNSIKSYRQECLSYPYQIAVLSLITILAISLYCPLVLQIYREAKSFDFSGVPNNGIWWSHPLRMLIPIFPNFDLAKYPLEPILKDRTVSSQFDGRTGLFWIILGVLGLWDSRKKLAIYVPLLLMFILCFFYNPTSLPTLQMFPWFSFNRVASRSTVIYPVIFGLLALGINSGRFRSFKGKLLAFSFVLLTCIEIATAYNLPTFDRDYPTFLFNNKDSFFSYMNYVKQQPGEAVLDWPFCVTGGNGVGTRNGLCSYFGQNSGLFALRRFHEKKVVGQYYGRLHPSQIEPFVKAGWYKLFSPTKGSSFSNKQSRCFYPEEWKFFTDFYQYNDFSGINLYTKMLPEACVAEFHKRFGSAVIETEVPGAGKVEFIPKSPELSNKVNLELGKKVQYKKMSELDLMRGRTYDKMSASEFNLLLSGLGKLEKSKDLDKSSRLGLFPRTTLAFRLIEPQPLTFEYTFKNLDMDRVVTVEINEKLFAQEEIKKNQIKNGAFRFEGLVGENTIEIKYSNPSSEPAILFTKLKLSNAR